MTKQQLPEHLLIEDVFKPIKNNIKYYIKNIDNYNCHIFCLSLNSTKDLLEYWQTFNAIIASNFQSQLEIDIELWNIYIIFIINDSITREVKYEIEQDKYSSRKIVFDHIIYNSVNNSEENLIALLQKKLFILQSKVVDNLSTQTSEDIINKIDPIINKALSNYTAGNKIDPFYELYFNLKNGE